MPEKPKEEIIRLIPTVKELLQYYGSGSAIDDQKAVGNFKRFESDEKSRRLQNELVWIKDNYVKEELCESIIGVKRKARAGTYQEWARRMLLWLVEARR